MSELPYSVKVTGPGLEISKAVDQQVALGVISVLMGGAGMRPATATTAEHRGNADSPDSTVGEFLSELNVRNNQERIAGIALYVREHLGEGRVHRDDLVTWFQRAGEPPPKNLTRDLNKAVSQNLVAEDYDRPDEFYVTSTGAKEIAAERAPEKRAAESNGEERGAKGPSPTKGKSTSRRKRSATAARQGPMDWLRTLIDGEFFTEHRAAADIVRELERRGAHYKTSDLTRQLQILVQEADLERVKKAPEGKSREVWHYQMP